MEAKINKLLTSNINKLNSRNSKKVCLTKGKCFFFYTFILFIIASAFSRISAIGLCTTSKIIMNFLFYQLFQHLIQRNIQNTVYTYTHHHHHFSRKTSTARYRPLPWLSITIGSVLPAFSGFLRPSPGRQTTF